MRWRMAAQRLARTLVIVAALATIPLVLADQQGVSGLTITVGYWLVWAAFVTESILHLTRAEERATAGLVNWLRIGVVVVTFPLLGDALDMVNVEGSGRTLQVVRLGLVTWLLLEMLRFVIGQRRIVYIAAATGVLVLAGGGALATIEPETVEGGFWDGVWWGVVTATTTGYGDITPKSAGGRLIGVLLMLAGIGLLSTLAASLAASFVEQDVNRERKAAERRLARMRDHIVICGLGRKGELLARAFLERGFEVVALERDESRPSVAALRALGVVVVVGDATDAATLGRSRLSTAEGIVAVCSDDDTNADVVIQADELTTGREGNPLRALAHIVDPLLCELFTRIEAGTAHALGFRLHFFNVFDGAARALLQAHPPYDPWSYGPPRQVLVVGLGLLGQRVVFNLARNWRERYLSTGERLRIALLDRDASAVQAALQTQYPQIDTACQLVAYDIEHGSAAYHEGRFLVDGAGAAGYGVVYVALGNDAASLSAALDLRARIRDTAVDVVVCLDESAGLVRLLGGGAGSPSRIEGLYPFRVLEQTCTPGVLLDSPNEALARVHHADYVRHERALGHTAAENASVVSWDELPEVLKESSRQAVDHIPVKLRAVGCTLEPMTQWDADLFEFTLEEVEVLAELEHQRWVDERVRAGFRYGPTRDEVARTHPDIMPWEEIGDDVKEKDRVFVRGLPAYLAGVGYQIVRRDVAGQPANSAVHYEHAPGS